ncbi:hypothetical protein A6V39_05570 [Candidatus Mycoplasma haematobovis]|uniref:Uncharacterized protein n=1 Tax=Candidatus Mycoplasma haematobovis TaxID=432608 RepID=A0A1A9QDE5_9MOLU|nr:hypothetical protein [Candidatus Mycoplasma haematobovis]OAL09719.1 hypothetical protein A6V39_05570 [Candidatus Mycoplasma haematobovis]
MENQEVIENKVTEASVEKSNNDEALKNIIEQQQQLIDQLTKQQELSKKVNDQLNETLNQRLKQDEEKSKDPYGWMEDAIGKNFEYQAKFNVNDNQDSFKGSEQLGSWYMKYLKDQGFTNEEVYSRLNRMFEGLKTGIQAHESL